MSRKEKVRITTDIMNGIMRDIDNRMSTRQLIRRWDYSHSTICRIRCAVTSIHDLDFDGLTDSYASGYLTQAMYEWAKEKIYSELDRLTTPDAKTNTNAVEPVKEIKEMTVPEWFSSHTNVMPELSAIFKMLSVAIDTMLDVYAKEGKEG